MLFRLPLPYMLAPGSTLLAVGAREISRDTVGAPHIRVSGGGGGDDKEKFSSS